MNIFTMTLLFGWLGYYRFKKKQILLGFIYLITCGIFFVGWLLDVYLAYQESKNPTANSEQTNQHNQQVVQEEPAVKSIYDFFITDKSSFRISQTAIELDGKVYPYAECEKIHIVSGYKIAFDGYALFNHAGKDYKLAYKQADNERAPLAFEFANRRIAEEKGEKLPLFSFISHLGSELLVYEDYIALTHVETTGSILEFIGKSISGGNKGSKKIDIADIVAIQHREPTGMSAGFVQFVFQGSIENRGGITTSINDENSIVYWKSRYNDIKIIVDYIEEKRRELKKQSREGVVSQNQTISSAEELKKYKELLDVGVITQEEFDTKKKQILGI